MEINITKEQVSELVGAAILKSIDENSKETLIKNAIIHLITPQKSSYSAISTSPLQDAFNSGVSKVAADLVAAELQKDTKMKDEIQKMIAEAWVKLIDPDRYSSIVSKMADAISKAITGDRY